MGMGSKLVHEDLSGLIIGAAMTVLNHLKPGLRNRGCETDQQRQFPVEYLGHPIGTLIPDLIVDGAVIVDTKVVSAFEERHVAQMTGYLAITGLKLGLLLNFRHSKLKWKRVVRTAGLSVP
jgi:GxxExxY protein